MEMVAGCWYFREDAPAARHAWATVGHLPDWIHPVLVDPIAGAEILERQRRAAERPVGKLQPAVSTGPSADADRSAVQTVRTKPADPVSKVTIQRMAESERQVEIPVEPDAPFLTARLLKELTRSLVEETEVGAGQRLAAGEDAAAG